MIQIGVIGAGAMGSGIAQVAAQAGHEVWLFDANAAGVPTALKKTAAGLGKLVEKGKKTADWAAGVMSRLHVADRLEAMSGCGLVIEAIVENLEVKQQVLRRVSELVAADCVVATNTSSLSVTSIASAVLLPERVVGIHFFNPAQVMELVEIIPAIQTAEETTARATSLIQSWGKTTVLAKDTPGFIVNRIARPFYGEALRIFEEGIADMATIDWAMTSIAGFRMGPFTLMDFIGHDVNYTVTETVFRSFFFDPRYKPSFSQKRLVEAGWLGRKSGRGFYNYADGAALPQPTQDEKLGKMIADRIVAMLINEAADALLWGIASPADIDTAMTKGVNYPKGLLRWAEDWGREHVAEVLDQLYNTYREDRYRCSPKLRIGW